MVIDNDLLHRGIENWLSPVYSSLYMSFFISLPLFSSKISPLLYKIESSYLVYRITTSCIVGLIPGFVLFILPYICYLFFLSMQSIP